MTELTQTETTTWLGRLAECLPLYGHRNWIVVADAAYPAQAKPGIETILANTDQISAASAVFEAIKRCGHVRANVYTDSELGYVEDSDARGLAAYRRQLDVLFAGANRKHLLHEEIIARLDKSAQMFRILIIKTDTTIPYTSVFFELDCAYWEVEAEGRLRRSIEASPSR